MTNDQLRSLNPNDITSARGMSPMSFDEVKRVARSLNWNVQTSSSNHNLFGLQHAFHGSTNVGYGRHSTEIRKQVAAILIAWQDGYDSAIIDLASN